MIEHVIEYKSGDDKWKLYSEYLKTLFKLSSDRYDERECTIYNRKDSDGKHWSGMYKSYLYTKKFEEYVNTYNPYKTEIRYYTERYVLDNGILGIISIRKNTKNRLKLVIEMESDYSVNDIDKICGLGKRIRFSDHDYTSYSTYKLHCYSVADKQKFQKAYDEFFLNYRSSFNTPASNNVHMTKEMHRRLLQLCHADKNGNSQSSHIATQWLLSLNIK